MGQRGPRAAGSSMSFAISRTTFIFCRQSEHRVSITAIAHLSCILTELPRGLSHSFRRILRSFGRFAKSRIHGPAQLAFSCEVSGCHESTR